MTGLAVPHEQAPALPDSLRSRLGLNIPAKWWPTRAGLKALEAAGFSWVQVHAPAESVLRNPRDVLRHARALRRELDTCGLRLAAALAGVEPAAFMDAAGPRVELFHVHDRFGARRRGETRPGVEPLRLDVHLPPGDGTIDWKPVVPRLARHEAPLMLEVHPPHRAEPTQLSHLFHRQFTTA